MSRTKHMHDEFSKALDQADQAVILKLLAPVRTLTATSWKALSMKKISSDDTTCRKMNRLSITFWRTGLARTWSLSFQLVKDLNLANCSLND